MKQFDVDDDEGLNVAELKLLVSELKIYYNKRPRIELKYIIKTIALSD